MMPLHNYFKIICLFSLGISTVLAQDSSDDTTIRGLIKPKEQATLSSEITGKILNLPQRSGEKFEKGNVLVKFDCQIYQSELKSAKAQHEAAYKRHENNLALLKLNATSDIEVAISKAEADKAYADVETASINANRCNIIAPYTGRVIQLLVNQYESVAIDQKLVSILNDENLEIEIIVPSNWLVWLEAGHEFDFRVDETGETHKAKVTQLGAVVDPVSQTIRLTAEFIDTSDNILSGMSGSAIFQR